MSESPTTSSRMNAFERIYAYGSTTRETIMVEQLAIHCVECLRILVDEKDHTVREPPYNSPGQNLLNGFDHTTLAHYCVDGTWYCAKHALPVYKKIWQEQQIHMIEESL